MKRDDVVAMLFVVSMLLVFLLGLFVKTDLPFSNEDMKSAGILIFLSGFLLFVWTLAYLNGSYLGNVEPVSETLIKRGPYRMVRHPAYLSMIIATLGLVVGMRSLAGIGALFLLFTPIACCRARLEEDALCRRFGAEWKEYKEKSHFMIPFIY